MFSILMQLPTPLRRARWACLHIGYEADARVQAAAVPPEPVDGQDCCPGAAEKLPLCGTSPSICALAPNPEPWQ